MHAQQIDITHGLLFPFSSASFSLFHDTTTTKTLQPIIHNMINSSTNNILKGMTTLYA